MTKKIIVPGIASAVIMLAVGMALSKAYTTVFPELAKEYANPALFRPWSDPVMSWYFVYPILVGPLLAWIWDETKSAFPETLSRRQKAVRFGLIYWLFSVCGMLMTYSSFPVSLLMVGSWTLSVLVEGMIASLILSKLNS